MHVSASDALVDPTITIRHENALPKKDPGYYPLVQQSTVARDRTSRVIHDYTGTPIIKVDQEGGIFDAQLGQGAYKTMSPLASPSQQHKQRGGATSLGGLYDKTFNRTERVPAQWLEVQQRMQKQAKSGAPGSDVDTTLSTRGLMQRKLYLMKKMLQNEKAANTMMK